MKSPYNRALNGSRASAALAAVLLVLTPFCSKSADDPKAASTNSPTASTNGAAQGRYNSQPHGTSILVDGSSTTHDWEMEGKIVGGYLEFGAGVTVDKSSEAPTGLQGDKVPAKSHIIIPVYAIHSKADHLPEVMDKLMREALKEDVHSTIEFNLTDLTFKSPHKAGDPYNFVVTGDLSIAGVKKQTSFPITVDIVDESTIKVTGTAPVKMTDYGVDPPAPNIGLGLMKCGDDVKIKFDWMLKKRK